MADDYYRYEPEGHRLVGERNGRIFRLADRVDVVLVGASPRVRGLDFKLAGMPAPEARPAGGPWWEEEKRPAKKKSSSPRSSPPGGQKREKKDGTRKRRR